MMESRSGFSVKDYKSTVISMPQMAFLLPGFSHLPINPSDVSLCLFNQDIQRELWFEKYDVTNQPLAPRSKSPQNSWTDMADRIGVSTVEVTKVKKSGNHPFLEAWSGSMIWQGSEVKFSTNLSGIHEGEQYRVVWERTEPSLGEQIVRLHEIIQHEKQEN